MSDTNSESFKRLEHQIAELRSMLAPVLSLAVRQKSRAAQAKAAGCCPSTLWRREKRLSAKLRLEGVK